MKFPKDGHNYENFEDIPDIGSWECTKVEDGNKRSYTGLSVDFSKLPTAAIYPEYKDLGDGSTALAADTGNLYMYEKSTDTWYEI